MRETDPREFEKLRERVEALESKLEFLFRRMGISQKTGGSDGLPEWKPSPQVLELLGKGDKKAALRLFMSESGASLKDAVTYIDSLG